jgi:hypothetical protein
MTGLATIAPNFVPLFAYLAAPHLERPDLAVAPRCADGKLIIGLPATPSIGNSTRSKRDRRPPRGRVTRSAEAQPAVGAPWHGPSCQRGKAIVCQAEHAVPVAPQLRWHLTRLHLAPRPHDEGRPHGRPSGSQSAGLQGFRKSYALVGLDSGGGIDTPTPDAQESAGRPTPHERTLASKSMSGVSPAVAPNGHPRMVRAATGGPPGLYPEGAGLGRLPSRESGGARPEWRRFDFHRSS